MFSNKDRSFFYKAMDKAEQMGDTLGNLIHKKSKFMIKGSIVLLLIIFFGAILLIASVIKKSVGKPNINKIRNFI